MGQLDKTDVEILQVLQKDAKVNTKELSEKLHISKTPIYERIKRLENDGYIKGLLRRWKRDYAPKMPEEAWHPLFVEALQKQSHVEYLLDVLLSPDMEERAVLIVDYGKEVSNLERRMAELAAQDTAGRRTDHTRSSPAPEH